MLILWEGEEEEEEKCVNLPFLEAAPSILWEEEEKSVNL